MKRLVLLIEYDQAGEPGFMTAWHADGHPGETMLALEGEWTASERSEIPAPAMMGFLALIRAQAAAHG